MSNPRKARILGSLVLISLAIIFLPWIFDGAGVKERQKMDTSIPPAPFVEDIVVEQPTREGFEDPISEPAEPQSQALEEAPVVATAPTQPQPSTTAAVTPRDLSLVAEKPVLDKEGVPVAWTLQLASFKDQVNAANLRSKLLKKGYKAYIRERDGLHKVYVGPDIQRTEIEKLRSQLQQEFKLDGLILRFSTH